MFYSDVVSINFHEPQAFSRLWLFTQAKILPSPRVIQSHPTLYEVAIKNYKNFTYHLLSACFQQQREDLSMYSD